MSNAVRGAVLAAATATIALLLSGCGSSPTATESTEPTTTVQGQTQQPTTTTQQPASTTQQTDAQSARPAQVYTCESAAEQRPTTYVLACADQGESLQNLTWTDWGEPSATATGQLSEQSCDPSCASGGTNQYSATVRVYGLADGRYTMMTVDAPKDPSGASSTYAITTDGPNQQQQGD